MGFRFRKSVKIFPGVRLNISKTGLSTSIGGRGATVNLSSRGTRATVGIPGSGLSYSTMLGRPSNRQPTGLASIPSAHGRSGKGCLLAIIVAVVLVLIGAAMGPDTATPSAAPAAALPSDLPETRVVTASSANCREDADKAARNVTKVVRGAEVTTDFERHGWTKVNTNPLAKADNQISCWISSELLAPSATTS